MAKLLAAAKGKLQRNRHYVMPMSQSDIDHGIPDSEEHCAVGNASRSSGCGDPRVKTPFISFNRGEYRYRAVMDSVAVGKDWLFDDKQLQKIHGPLRPGNIVIEVIDVRLRTKLGTRASRGLPPKGPHRPRVRSKDNVCSPVKRRYHELQKYLHPAEAN